MFCARAPKVLLDDTMVPSGKALHALRENLVRRLAERRGH